MACTNEILLCNKWLPKKRRRKPRHYMMGEVMFCGQKWRLIVSLGNGNCDVQLQRSTVLGVCLCVSKWVLGLSHCVGAEREMRLAAVLDNLSSRCWTASLLLSTHKPPVNVLWLQSVRVCVCNACLVIKAVRGLVTIIWCLSCPVVLSIVSLTNRKQIFVYSFQKKKKERKHKIQRNITF